MRFCFAGWFYRSKRMYNDKTWKCITLTNQLLNLGCQRERLRHGFNPIKEHITGIPHAGGKNYLCIWYNTFDELLLVIDICSCEKTSSHKGTKTHFVLYSQLRELLDKNKNGQSEVCFVAILNFKTLKYLLTNIFVVPSLIFDRSL